MSNEVKRMSFIVKPAEPGEVVYRSRDNLKIVGNYVFGRRLGEGSYGKVKEGVQIDTRNRVAVKIYVKRNMKKIGAEASAQKEVEIMRSLRNDYVVQAIDDFYVKDKLYVVLEYVNGGTLQDLLDRPNSKLPLGQLRKFFKGIVRGLIYLQAEGIIHRDIKPDNILLTSHGHVKIGDFGVAIKIDLSNEQSLENFKWRQGDIGGSPAFQPPECQEVDYSSLPDLDELGPLITKRDGKIAPLKLDVWSAGVVLYMMVVGKYPFDIPNPLSLFTNIARGKFTIPDWIGSELNDLLSGILQVDPDNRLSLIQIRKHNWMKIPIKDGATHVKIEPIPSLFPNDKATLNQVLEDLLNKSSDRKLSPGGDDQLEFSDTISDDPDQDSDITDSSEVEDKRKRIKKKPRIEIKRSSSRGMKGFFRKDSKISEPEKKEEKEKVDVRHSRKSSSSEKRFSRRLSAVMTTSSLNTDTPAQLEREKSKSRERRNSSIITNRERRNSSIITNRERRNSSMIQAREENKKCIIF
jgi:serine/threonine protein kinase